MWKEFGAFRSDFIVDIQILSRGAFGSALVTLEPEEKFVSESGAMYRTSGNVDVDVTTRSRSSGGFFSGVKRALGSEHFFFSTYSVTGPGRGEVGLAPTLQGEIRRVDMDGSVAWLCAGGSYLGSEPSLDVDTQFQGLKGFFTGESVVFLRVSGSGALLVNAFGRVSEVDVQGGLVVDTGHVVAFEESLNYSVTKAAGSWFQSFLTGEGFVLNFEGTGKVLVQSHNPSEFGRRLGIKLPERS